MENLDDPVTLKSHGQSILKSWISDGIGIVKKLEAVTNQDQQFTTDQDIFNEITNALIDIKHEMEDVKLLNKLIAIAMNAIQAKTKHHHRKVAIVNNLLHATLPERPQSLSQDLDLAAQNHELDSCPANTRLPSVEIKSPKRRKLANKRSASNDAALTIAQGRQTEQTGFCKNGEPDRRFRKHKFPRRRRKSNITSDPTQIPASEDRHNEILEEVFPCGVTNNTYTNRYWSTEALEDQADNLLNYPNGPEHPEKMIDLTLEIRDSSSSSDDDESHGQDNLLDIVESTPI